jgi:hypothetical protein
MRRRLLILAALLVPATAEAQQAEVSTTARRRAAALKSMNEAAQPTGGASMRGQSTRPGLRAGHAYRHEKERDKRRPVSGADL